MAIVAYENGVLLWYDTMRELDSVLERTAKLITEETTVEDITKLATDARNIKDQIKKATMDAWLIDNADTEEEND